MEGGTSLPTSLSLALPGDGKGRKQVLEDLCPEGVDLRGRDFGVGYDKGERQGGLCVRRKKGSQKRMEQVRLGQSSPFSWDIGQTLLGIRSPIRGASENVEMSGFAVVWLQDDHLEVFGRGGRKPGRRFFFLFFFEVGLTGEGEDGEGKMRWDS